MIVPGLSLRNIPERTATCESRYAIEAHYRAICDRQPPGGAHWLFDRTFPLQPRTWVKVDIAIRNVRSGRRPPTSGQVIAELSLGFWRFTARGYWTTIWRSHLSHAFPHAPGPPHAATMDRQLDAIIKLRNRIAHHEPIGRIEDVQRRIDDMLELGSWISPAMAGWWRGRTSVWQVLTDIPSCM